MHHSLKLYSRNREWALRFYLFGAKLTSLPLIGWVVRRVANAYGRNMESACLLTTAEAEDIVGLASGLAVGPCTCREVSGKCDNPVNTEIMLGSNSNAFVAERPADYREITAAEARDILRQCHQKGLIHSIVRCRQDFYAICNCCSCCCVPLRLSRQYGIGSALTRHPDIVGEFRAHQLSHQV